MQTVNAKGLAEALGCSEAFVRKHTRFGMPYEPVGRLRFYDVGAVRGYLKRLDERKQKARQKTNTAHDDAG